MKNPAAVQRSLRRSVTLSDLARLAGLMMTMSRTANTPDQVLLATLKHVDWSIANPGNVLSRWLAGSASENGAEDLDIKTQGMDIGIEIIEPAGSPHFLQKIFDPQNC